ncbi:DUF2855 family protein [Arenicella sp. 4NH20-0111]|uniref:DUF2855 family protein n=1 Tax=Arenicella sp. 4NH20-0111 TaxID=3127648 RepID=UPI003104BC7B
MQVLQSKKENFNEFRVIDVPTQEVNLGEIRVNVERFSFTANNVTYAVLGDYLKYWSFFPAKNADGTDASTEWGQIPVWGFGVVTESRCEHVNVGERFFGYFPPAQECVMKPSNVERGSYIDGSEHRAHLPAGYNIYRSAPAVDHQADNERSLLFPLFVTAYSIHDLLSDKDWFNADQILIISASSKTSVGVAYALQNDEGSPKSIGLTSKRNRSSVENLNLYDQVLSYEEIENIDATKSTIIVDMSGNKSLLSALHQHLSDNMKHTLNVGITHWNDLSEVSGINTDRCEQFFAPGHIQEMIKRMGPKEFQVNSGTFVVESALKTRSWLECVELNGLLQLSERYIDVCEGNIDSNTGLMVINT